MELNKLSEESISGRREESTALNTTAKSYKMKLKKLSIRFDNVQINGELDKSYLYRGSGERLIGSGLKEWGEK